jgi:ATP-binding cassette, subfamily C, bacterial CydCD
VSDTDVSSGPRGPIDPRLLRRVPALRAHLVRSAATAVVLTVAVLVQAELIGRYLPRLIHGDGAAGAPLALALVAVGLTRGLLRHATEWSAARALTGTRRTLTTTVLDHVVRLDEAGSAAAPPSRTVALVTSGVDALEPWVRSYLPALCLAVVLPLAAGFRILLADPVSALILLVAIPLIPVFMVLIGKMTADRTSRQWAGLQRLAGHFHGVLVGLPTLRLFGRADAQVGRVRDVAEQYRSAVMRTLRVAFLSALALELLATLSVALVAVSIGVRLAAGGVGLGTALVVLLLAPECSLPLRRVGAAYHASATGQDAADEVEALLDLPTAPDGSATSVAAGPLVVSGVGVVDPERGRRAGPVDLTVRAGELVALVGPSGSGKTTLLDAVSGRIPVEDASMSIGATMLDDLAWSTRTASVAVVTQLPAALGADVRASVALGAPGAPAARVDQVLDHLDLRRLEHRRPTELSGGELRRVAVARAALRAERPEVRLLLADEPTAQLDRERADAVIGELRSVAASGVAVVVATHDPRLRAAADRVVELTDGPGGTTSTVAAAPAAPVRPPRVPAGVVQSAEPVAALPADALPGEAGPGDVRWLHHLGRDARGRLVLARTLGVAAEACTVGLAATAAWLIVRAAERPSFVELAVAAVMVRAFGLGKGVLRYWERLASHDATFRLLGQVRGAVVARLGRVAPAGVPGWANGDLVARVVDDVDRIGDLELRVVGPTVSGLVVGAGAAVGVALAVPAAGAVVALAVLVVGVITPLAVASAAARLVPGSTAARTDLADTSMELSEHAAEITGSGAAGHWTARVDDAVERLADIDRRRARRIGPAAGVAAAASAWTAAAVVLVAGPTTLRLTGPVLGVVVLVPFALMEVLSPLVESGELYGLVGSSAARLRALLGLSDPVTDPEVPVPTPTRTDVVLDDLHVRWPGAATDVIAGLDLAVAPGEHVAVIGASGTGKSTLAAALVRFVAPGHGAYRLGGVDTGALDGDTVRTEVTWCQQDPWLPDTSLREVLRMASPEADDDELRDALASVHLDEWARALPRGLDTRVGADGAAVSGGQRQRLALARVLLGGQRVVVLDEPTSHLDDATAAAVLHDLVAALEGRTVVLLGHDERTVPAGWRSVELPVAVTSHRDPAPSPVPVGAPA